MLRDWTGEQPGLIQALLDLYWMRETLFAFWKKDRA